jgi:hypothetical protein
LPETCSFLPNVTPNGFPRLLGPQAVVRASKGVDHPHGHFVVHGHVVESHRAERMEKTARGIVGSPCAQQVSDEPLNSVYVLTPVRDRRHRTRLPREGLHLASIASTAAIRAFASVGPPSFTPRAFARKNAEARPTLIQCRGRRWQAMRVTNVPSGEQLWCYCNTFNIFEQRHIAGRIAWSHEERISTNWGAL